MTIASCKKVIYLIFGKEKQLVTTPKKKDVFSLGFELLPAYTQCILDHQLWL